MIGGIRELNKKNIFEETNVNKLTNSAFDPIAKIPELKVCTVEVTPA